jgi:hypothetical protein
MTNSATESPEEVERRFHELYAQHSRARQLFHCYAPHHDELDADEEEDDVYVAYYAEAAQDDR